MPEISEVRLTSEWVTRKNRNRKIADVEYLPSNKLKLIEEIDVVGSTLSADSRGKEMKLWFDDEPVVITLGMAGSFKNFTERGTDEDINWRHSHIRFLMDDGEWFTWNDIRRFGKSLRKDWNPERGPDIFDEEREFKRNIFENINHRDFTKPAHEVLMNQKWFNGIGNYLRAEILGKWNVNPFQPMVDIISEDFLNHLIKQVYISYQLGGGELYTWMNEDGIPPHDTQEWDKFIQFYGKAEKVKDRQKRTFWFHEKWLQE